LKRLIKKKGLLHRQPAYYAGRMAFTLGLLAVSMALLFVLGDTWFQLLNAIYLAFVFVQISPRPRLRAPAVHLLRPLEE
jgi:hypothetical protein